MQLDYVDKYLFYRAVFIQREDILTDSKCFYVLTIIRRLNSLKISCSIISIFIQLKFLKRQLNTTHIADSLRLLLSSGYIRRSAGRGTVIYITESGKKALIEINEAMIKADYKRSTNFSKKPVLIKKPLRIGS